MSDDDSYDNRQIKHCSREHLGQDRDFPRPRAAVFLACASD